MSLDDVDSIAAAAEEFDISNVEAAEDEFHDEQEGMVAFVDFSDESFCPTMVRRARAEELEYVKSMGVYEVVDVQECYKQTRKSPITAK